MANTYTEDSASISTTEYFLMSGSTSQTAQTSKCLMQAFLDFANMVAGDEYEVKIYEKVTSGGTQRTIYMSRLEGTQGSPFITPALNVGNGWEVSVKQISGSARTIYWSIRQVS